MKTLIGGAVAFILGVVGITVWYNDLFTVLAGIVPLMLLLGGGLALYLGFDEVKDACKKDESTPGCGDDVEQYKKEIDDLKKEIDTLKGEDA